MTLQIAICDDEKEFCSEFKAVLEKMLNAQKVSHRIDVFHSGEELCKKMKSAAYYNLIFLDIEFSTDEINGIEVGKQIRNIYERHTVSIVYISWEMKYSMQLFDIRPLNFLIKPLKYEKIEQVIQTYLKLSGIWVDSFVYKIRQDIYKVRVRDIVYLESMNRQMILHLADDRREVFYGTLKTIYQEQLHKLDFLHIHASYAVNYNYVSLLARSHVVLTHKNITLPISRQKKTEADKTYFAILERRGVV